jgi:hypothetical protein
MTVPLWMGGRPPATRVEEIGRLYGIGELSRILRDRTSLGGGRAGVGLSVGRATLFRRGGIGRFRLRPARIHQ